MKQKILLIGIVLIQLVTLNAKAQIIFTKNDTLNIENDSLILKVDKQRGDVIWQVSKTLDEWNDLQNETRDSLIFHSIDSSSYYRAMIIDGTCEPVFSDTTYVLRALTDSIINAILNDSSKIGNQIALFDSENENSTITIIDTSSVMPVVQIITTGLPDTIQPGWIIVDTTGVGKIFMVTDYTIQKSGADFITKIIDGVQVGIDFLITDQTLSYSSPANRTKLEWNNSLKLNNSGMFKGDLTYNLEQGEQNLIVNNSNELLSLNFLNKELWNLNTGTTTMRFWIESGTISLKPALDFYAEYVPSVIATKLLSSFFTLNPFLSLPEFTTKGRLNDLKLITYNDFDIDLKLKIEASVHQDISDKIKPVKLIEYFYSIPAGPIFITVKTELFARLIFEATGEVNVNPEVQWNNNIVLGVVGHKNGNQFNKEFITSYSDKKSLSSSIEGNFNFRQRLEIVPKIEVYAMGMVGMNAETIPFQEFIVNASITDSSPLIYDYSFDVGVDASASFDISAFHLDNVTLPLFKKDFEILAKKNVFSAPYTLEYLSGNNQTGNPGQYLSTPISVKAIDSRGSIMKNYPVFYDVLSGGGNFQSDYSLSNNYGISENNWQLGSSGSQTSRAYLKKANQQIINRGVLNFNATINEVNLPVLTTTVITSITQTTATSGGNITSDGGAAVTARGVCWSTSQNPAIDNCDKTIDGSGTGSFTSHLTGLTAGTTYYVRAYATNSEGTAYGEQETFKAKADEATSGTFTDSRDGIIYKWIKIGEQVWMAENLGYLPQINQPGEESETEPYYCVYGYTGGDIAAAKATGNYATCGVLYNWPAAMEVCPVGWHLPSKSEWEQLAQFVNDTYGPYEINGAYWFNTAAHLKATHGWDNNGNGTDDLGFSAFPGGYYGENPPNIEFTGVGNSGYWWTDSNYWFMYHFTNTLYGLVGTGSKVNCYSIRCIRD